MKIKVDSLFFAKDRGLSNEKAFRVWDLKFKLVDNTLERDNNDSEILKCLKGVIKDNNGVILYDEIKEIVDTSNIIGNNFWNEEYFINTCRFEFRDYFDFTECKFIYV